MCAFIAQFGVRTKVICVLKKLFTVKSGSTSFTFSFHGDFRNVARLCVELRLQHAKVNSKEYHVIHCEHLAEIVDLELKSVFFYFGSALSRPHQRSYSMFWVGFWYMLRCALLSRERHCDGQFNELGCLWASSLCGASTISSLV